MIPASIFYRTIFDEIGGFPEEYRAGEDLVWLNRSEVKYGIKKICYNAIVRYKHFPENHLKAWNKWQLFEKNSILANVRIKKNLIFFLILATLYFLVIFYPKLGIFLFLIYILIRGIIDPIRRSKDRPWWGKETKAILIAPFLAVLIDLAKWIGIVKGFSIKIILKIRCKKLN